VNGSSTCTTPTTSRGLTLTTSADRTNNIITTTNDGGDGGGDCVGDSCPWVQVGKKHCKSIFQEMRCGNISMSFYTEACTVDGAAIGSLRGILDTGKNIQQTFISECFDYLSGLCRSPYERDREIASRDAINIGIVIYIGEIGKKTMNE
jgi:hypothetical protein